MQVSEFLSKILLLSRYSVTIRTVIDKRGMIRVARLASIIGLSFFLLWGSLNAEVVTLTPKIWNGEALQKDEGLFYLQAAIIDSGAQHRNGAFSFVLFGKNLQKSYSVQYETTTLGQHPDKVWKLKEDEYQVLQIQHIDAQGKRWTWKGPYRSSFFVKGQSLANLGIWYLVQLKQAGQLSFLAKPSKNIFLPGKSQGSIARIIDGLTGYDQLTLEQKAAQKKGEIRAVLRSSRTIGMFYKLNLFRQNQSANSVMGVIQSNDPDLRSCYTDLLDRAPPTQGSMVYTMVLSNQTQSLKTLKIKKADIQDPKFSECLYYKLMALSFPVKESMIGELSLIFQIIGS